MLVAVTRLHGPNPHCPWSNTPSHACPLSLPAPYLRCPTPKSPSPHTEIPLQHLRRHSCLLAARPNHPLPHHNALGTTSLPITHCPYLTLAPSTPSTPTHTQKYPFNTYGDTVACWLQDLIILALILKPLALHPVAVAAGSVGFAALSFWLFFGGVPMHILEFLQVWGKYEESVGTVRC